MQVDCHNDSIEDRINYQAKDYIEKLSEYQNLKKKANYEQKLE